MDTCRYPRARRQLRPDNQLQGTNSYPSSSPIGVFDSGVGGLSVLRAIRCELPQEALLYFADSAHAPYGDRDSRFIMRRAEAVTALLVGAGVKAIVIACNTA